MKIGEWLNSKLTEEKMKFPEAKGSLRYNGFYINIFIKDTLGFNDFKKYYDTKLKGKSVELAEDTVVDFNTSDGSIVSKFVSLVKLGGIKPKEVLKRKFGMVKPYEINKKIEGIQITLWFPDVKYA